MDQSVADGAASTGPKCLVGRKRASGRSGIDCQYVLDNASHIGGTKDDRDSGIEKAIPAFYTEGYYNTAGHGSNYIMWHKV